MYKMIKFAISGNSISGRAATISMMTVMGILTQPGSTVMSMLPSERGATAAAGRKRGFQPETGTAVTFQ